MLFDNFIHFVSLSFADSFARQITIGHFLLLLLLPATLFFSKCFFCSSLLKTSFAKTFIWFFFAHTHTHTFQLQLPDSKNPFYFGSLAAFWILNLNAFASSLQIHFFSLSLVFIYLFFWLLAHTKTDKKSPKFLPVITASKKTLTKQKVMTTIVATFSRCPLLHFCREEVRESYY